MSYQSLIDDAIARARVKVASAHPHATDKLASAPVQGGEVLAEAEKLANALEYLAMATADDGTAMGAARAEMVRDFFKTAAEADKKKAVAQPLVTETMTSGTQKVAPQTGKAKLAPQGLVSGDAPKQTTAPDGAMSRNALEQTPSASPTKAASLYDMLMDARMAKIAAESGAASPRQMDAEQAPPAHPKAQEGGHAQGPLSSSERIVAAKRRELHAPSRSRLSEIFAHSGDTAQSMESAAGTFPLAAAKGGMKVAASPAQIAKAMAEEKADKKEEKESKKEEKAEKKASIVHLAARMQKEAAKGEEEYDSKADARRAALAATLGSAVPLPLPTGPAAAYLASERHKGAATAGSLAGGLGGGIVGRIGGHVVGGPIGSLIGSAAGNIAGSGLGAYGAHRMAAGDKEAGTVPDNFLGGKHASVADTVGDALKGPHGNKLLAAGIVGTGGLTLLGRQALQDMKTGRQQRKLQQLHGAY